MKNESRSYPFVMKDESRNYPFGMMNESTNYPFAIANESTQFPLGMTKESRNSEVQQCCVADLHDDSYYIFYVCVSLEPDGYLCIDIH